MLPKLLDAMQRELKQAGLEMNPAKTQIYLPRSAHYSTEAELESLWQKSGSHEGMIICGNPVEAT